jgi:two-component system nitrate/nitrite response regulator NarL
MMASRIRVLLVDDHSLFREGLCSLLSAQPDIEVVGQAGDGLEALVMARELRPDLILMDVTMPGMDGLEAMERIIEILPDCKIVMLTVHDDQDRLFEAIKGGAVGYVLKSTASGALIPMLRGAMRGEAAIGGAMSGRILEEFARLARQQQAPIPDKKTLFLTARERQVLRQVSAGATDKEIAAELSLSLSTVKTHMRNILSKLHATSRHQAASYAVQQGLIRAPS